MIPKEIIKKIKKIEIYTNRVVTEQLAGQYHSIFKGKGLNFRDVRKYMPGDDIRDIDWKVTARMQEPYIREYTEERELTVNIIVDISSSGIFGTINSSKFERMAEIASMFAFSAIKNNDKVGLILFSDKIEKYIPPKKGKKHVLNIISQILTFKPENNKTSIDNALKFFASVNKKSTVAFLISDFFDENDFDKSLKVSNRLHDIIPIIVRDPLEENMIKMGIVNFLDPETNEIISINTNDRILINRYNSYIESENKKLANKFKKLSIEYIKIDMSKSYIESIVYFFKKRASKKRRR
jgi:uncharacterized protein (DUF58 family)